MQASVLNDDTNCDKLPVLDKKFYELIYRLDKENFLDTKTFLARKTFCRLARPKISWRDNLAELIAISQREILTQVGEVIQIFIVGNEFLGGVASLNQNIQVAEHVGDF